MSVPRATKALWGIERAMRGKSLAAMELADSLGGRTSLVFADLKPNAAVPAASFTFTPPKGADVMDETK